MFLSPLSSAFTLLVLNGCKYDFLSSSSVLLCWFYLKKSDHKKLKSVTSNWFCLTCFSSQDFKFSHDFVSLQKNRTFLGLLLSPNKDLA